MRSFQKKQKKKRIISDEMGQTFRNPILLFIVGNF